MYWSRVRGERCKSRLWRLLGDTRGVSGRSTLVLLTVGAGALGGKELIGDLQQGSEAGGQITGDAVTTARCVADDGSDCISTGDGEILLAQTYCNTVTGTHITWCSGEYDKLHPTARRILDAHERVHQGQNPFTQGHDCREVPAYRVQAQQASQWLSGRCSTSYKTQEGRDVGLVCHEANENGALYCSRCKSCRGWTDVSCC
jgi:hypothetical protein